MRIVYLPSAARDVAWFRHYYQAVFPEGDDNARRNLKAIHRLLAANPYVGRPSSAHEGVRELHIRKTPFTLIYRVTERQIEVLRLWDDRRGG